MRFIKPYLIKAARWVKTLWHHCLSFIRTRKNKRASLSFEHRILLKQLRAARCLNWITFVGLGGLVLAYLNTIADERAWISVTPVGGAFAFPSFIVKAKVANTGKEPAVNTYFSLPHITFLDVDPNTLEPDWPNEEMCKGIETIPNGPVYFPGTLGEREIQLPIPSNSVTPKDWQDVLDYKKGILITGCLAYHTFYGTHYTQYCIFERRMLDRTTQPTDCKKGTHVD